MFFCSFFIISRKKKCNVKAVIKVSWLACVNKCMLHKSNYSVKTKNGTALKYQIYFAVAVVGAACTAPPPVNVAPLLFENVDEVGRFVFESSIFLSRFFGMGLLASKCDRIVSSHRWVLEKGGLFSGSSSQQAIAMRIKCLGQSASQYFLRNSSTLRPKSLVRGK